MIFLSGNSASCGSTFLGIDDLTISHAPTNLDHINKIELYNGRFDDLYVTHNMDVQKIVDNTIPGTWDFDTVLMAQFDDDTSAGNVNWHLKDLDYVAIKVKPQDDHKWITCHFKKVNSYDDLQIIGKYLAAMTGIWDVALIPISSGNIEGTYIQVKVDVNVNKLVLLDEDAIHSTFLVDSAIAMQSVMPSQAVNTLHNKFPYIIRNTRANYETIEVTCTFLPNDEECLDLSGNLKAQAKWSRELKGWLMNGKTKLLKTDDGDMWLGYITSPVSDQPYDNGVSELRKYTFGLTETGLPNNEDDLLDAHLLNYDWQE